MSENNAVGCETCCADPQIAGGKEPGRGKVVVGYYITDAGFFLLVPVLFCYDDASGEGDGKLLDQVSVGPIFGPDGLGFDLLSQSDAEFVPLYSTTVDFPRSAADVEKTRLVLAVRRSDGGKPSLVALGVWDGSRVCLVSHGYRYDETNIARWLLKSNLPHVTWNAPPETTCRELGLAVPEDLPRPVPEPDFLRGGQTD